MATGHPPRQEGNHKSELVPEKASLAIKETKGLDEMGIQTV